MTLARAAPVRAAIRRKHRPLPSSTPTANWAVGAGATALMCAGLTFIPAPILFLFAMVTPIAGLFALTAGAIGLMDRATRRTPAGAPLAFLGLVMAALALFLMWYFWTYMFWED